jgi:hypothetical protein
MLGRAKRIGNGIVGQRREGKADQGQCGGEFHYRLPFPDSRFWPCFEGRYTPGLRHVKGATDARNSHLMTQCSMLVAE